MKKTIIIGVMLALCATQAQAKVRLAGYKYIYSSSTSVVNGVFYISMEAGN